MKRQKIVGAIALLLSLSLSLSGCAFPLAGLAIMAATSAVGTGAGTVAAKKMTEQPQQASATPATQAQQPAAPIPAAKPSSEPMQLAKAAEPNAPAKLTPAPAEKTFDAGATLAEARKAKKGQGLKGVMFQDRTSKAWFLEDQEGCTWKLRGGTFCKI